MLLGEIRHLYYVAPIENVESILENGILCHSLAAIVPGRRDISSPEVQKLRASIHWSGHLPLHDYACLFINVRNSTLYRMLRHSQGICVLLVSPDVCGLDGVIVTTGNAASSRSKQLRWNGGLALEFLASEEVFASSWKDTLGQDLPKIKNAMSAEILVPYKVESRYIQELVVPTNTVARSPKLHNVPVPVTIDEHMFFLS